jgi:hypothetical protein
LKSKSVDLETSRADLASAENLLQSKSKVVNQLQEEISEMLTKLKLQENRVQKIQDELSQADQMRQMLEDEVLLARASKQDADKEVTTLKKLVEEEKLKR